MTHAESRALVAAGILAMLTLLALSAPAFVTPVALVLLIPAPVLCWRAYFRLRRNLGQRRGDPPSEIILSLSLAVDRAWYLAVAATALAVLCLFVAARSANLIGPIGATFFTVLLLFPLVIAGYLPALDTLRTLNRLEKSK